MGPCRGWRDLVGSGLFRTPTLPCHDTRRGWVFVIKCFLVRVRWTGPGDVPSVVVSQISVCPGQVP